MARLELSVLNRLGDDVEPMWAGIRRHPRTPIGDLRKRRLFGSYAHCYGSATYIHSRYSYFLTRVCITDASPLV